MNIRAGRIAGAALLGISLLLAFAVAMPQGKGPKNGGPSRGSSENAGNRDSGNATRPTPGPPSNNARGPNGARLHQTCVQECNDLHKQETQACKVRTGPDRA